MHPLLNRLVTELGWPHLTTMEQVDDFLSRPGAHCLLIPGDPVRNLETADAAVVLPELRMTFQNVFDCALVGDEIEAALREKHHVLKTPGFLFFRNGQLQGAIAKIRDWDDYMARVPAILNLATVEN